jgi:MerR family regulatory protein
LRHPTSPGIQPPRGVSDPLTSGDVAALFNVDPKTVIRWENEGKLTSIRTPGGHRRFPWPGVRKLLENSCRYPRPEASRHAGFSSSASVQAGAGVVLHLDLTPVPAEVTEPGHVMVVLGWTRTGKPVTLTVTSLEWLDDLEFAIQAARAAGVVEGEMAVAGS